MNIYSKQFLMNTTQPTESGIAYPLTIVGSKNRNLYDYTIYGNTQDGVSVGDLVESGEHIGKYKIPIVARGLNNADYTKAVEWRASWGTLTVGDGYVRFVGMNFFVIPVTLEKNTTYRLSTDYTVNSGTADYLKWRYEYSDGSDGSYVNYGASSKTDASKTVSHIVIAISSGGNADVTFENIMLSKGSAATTYEPYITPVTTNLYLDNPIATGQSVTKRTPAVPQFKGTTIYETETTVKPTGIKVKYY